jgi:hypothetical protein
VVLNTWAFFQNGVKKCWALTLSLQTWGKNEFLAKWYSVPGEKVSNRCRVSDQGGTEFTLTPA